MMVFRLFIDGLCFSWTFFVNFSINSLIAFEFIPKEKQTEWVIDTRDEPNWV